MQNLRSNFLKSFFLFLNISASICLLFLNQVKAFENFDEVRQRVASIPTDPKPNYFHKMPTVYSSVNQNLRLGLATILELEQSLFSPSNEKKKWSAELAASFRKKEWEILSYATAISEKIKPSAHALEQALDRINPGQISNFRPVPKGDHLYTIKERLTDYSTNRSQSEIGRSELVALEHNLVLYTDELRQVTRALYDLADAHALLRNSIESQYLTDSSFDFRTIDYLERIDYQAQGGEAAWFSRISSWNHSYDEKGISFFGFDLFKLTKNRSNIDHNQILRVINDLYSFIGAEVVNCRRALAYKK